MAASAQGFLLLALRDTQLSSPSLRDTGTLCLECVTIPAYDADRDVWLVLRLNAFEMPLSPMSPMRYTRSSRTYTFDTAIGPITISLPQPRSAADEEDIETLEVILSQYGPLQTDSDVEDSKGAALGLDDADLKGSSRLRRIRG
ncbi:hypothetical protein BD410DRAFT_843970 [Rickenella mellea]|uniref:Uncharacterized protein n=1 Tax=Rickenella mellea TaxID=50990 RepID=A0A4Y7PNF5_9AGAM|nr:hypothetical protein BD410DRAFT_843970 [Rickenella mellea]